MIAIVVAVVKIIVTMIIIMIIVISKKCCYNLLLNISHLVLYSLLMCNFIVITINIVFIETMVVMMMMNMNIIAMYTNPPLLQIGAVSQSTVSVFSGEASLFWIESTLAISHDISSALYQYVLIVSPLYGNYGCRIGLYTLW